MDLLDLSPQAEEYLHEMFTLPGFELLRERLTMLTAKMSQDVITAAREARQDRYEIGQYDGAVEVNKFIDQLRQYATAARRPK